MNRFDLKPYSSDKFTVVKYTDGTKALVVEMSELEFGFERLYRDSIDMGLAIKSERTGRVVHFVVYRSDTRNGEVYGWELYPMSGDHILTHSPYRVLVIND